MTLPTSSEEEVSLPPPWNCSGLEFWPQQLCLVMRDWDIWPVGA